jgi:hypothetical protein
MSNVASSSTYERRSPKTSQQEATDYARWIELVPEPHRDLVVAWVVSCSPAGRTLGWKAYRQVTTDEAAATELLRCALAARDVRKELTPFDRLSL